MGGQMGTRRKQVRSTDEVTQYLDLNGNPMIEGLRGWILFYKLLGHINWIGYPLYLSIIYKLLVLLYSAHRMWTRYVLKLYELHIISEDYRNPIFLLIGFLGLATFFAQVIVIFRANLFDLSPIFKILHTSKLCFLQTSELKVIGSNTMILMMLLHAYQCLLLSMLVCRNLSEFIASFTMGSFILDWYANTVFIYYLVGMSHLDFYIRSAFGHWLMALKSCLELQFDRLHRYRRNQQRLKTLASNCSTNAHTSIDEPLRADYDSSSEGLTGTGSGKLQQLPFLTFDEIQRQLNNMDDHLEVFRSVLIATLVLLALSAFLCNGALLLITYNLLANESNFYHGTILLLTSINYAVLVFISYAGDQWIYHTLGLFVQTVEDEYFMQHEGDFNSDLGGVTTREPESVADNSSVVATSSLGPKNLPIGALLIRKKDVLFCREFLYQFENHLSTPWSNLTFQTHLGMARTFVTLIAAQIIFDHEH